MTNAIGFIGLGVMGGPMAAHLLEHRNELNIVFRNSKKTKQFISKFKKSKNLNIYSNLKDFSKNSRVIISCVGNDKDLKKYIFLKMEY